MMTINMVEEEHRYLLRVYVGENVQQSNQYVCTYHDVQRRAQTIASTYYGMGYKLTHMHTNDNTWNQLLLMQQGRAPVIIHVEALDG